MLAASYAHLELDDISNGCSVIQQLLEQRLWMQDCYNAAEIQISSRVPGVESEYLQRIRNS